MEEDVGSSVKFRIDLSRAIRRLQESTSNSNISLNLNSFVKSHNGNVSLDLDALASLSINPTITSSVLCAFYPLFPDIAARWLAIADDASVTSAFARVVSVSPHIAIHADAYLETGWKGGYDLQGLIALYRLLIFDKRRFGRLVYAKEILSIITDNAVAGANKLLGILIWALHLDLSDAATNAMVERYLSGQTMMGEFEGEKDVDFLFFTLFEAKRISLLNRILSDMDYSCDSLSDSVIVNDTELSLRTANLCGVLVPRHKPLSTSVSPLIYTCATINNVRSLAMVLRTASPLLITGPPGSGKSFLIDNLLSILSRTSNDIVKLHLGEQTDTKLLVGSYATGETPGSFMWKQGILASAVKHGKVVVVEDIDKAPNEVLSVLLSLVQQREISVPSRGQIIRAANSFQIVATITEQSSSHTKDFIGRQLWTHVRLEMIDDDELEQIVALKYPRLRSLAGMMRQVYVVVREAYKSPKFVASTRGAQCRTFSARDLMKWARRVDVLLSRSGGLGSLVADGVSCQVFDAIFYEAVDVFAGSIRIPQGRVLVVGVIGSAMNVEPHVIQHYLSSHVPGLDVTGNSLTIGRVVIRKPPTLKKRKTGLSASWFAHTKHTLRLLEQIATCVSMREPVLLVGETGTGKTTVVQQLSSTIGAHLTVINVSQQTEAADLLGGYKPVDVKTVAVPLREEFDILFENTFSSRRNERFTTVFSKCFLNSQWANVIRLWKEAVKMAQDVIAKQLSLTEEMGEDKPSKRRRIDPLTGENLLRSWQDFAQKISAFEVQHKNIENSFVYRFIEGALVRAVRNGDWVLLDEINLAAPDTLEHIADLLMEGGEGACIQLSETGDVGAVQAHPNFRLFACMNPATDVGKRDLPAGFRARFTEIYVGSPDHDPADLLSIVEKYIGQLAVGNDGEGACQDVVNMYLEAKRLAENHLIVDGASQKPHFSIRTLSRTLVYVHDIVPSYGLRRALYEGFCMAFLTLLDKMSENVLLPIIAKYTIGKLRNPRSVMSKVPNKPEVGKYIQFKHYWLEAGPYEPDDQEHYIITPFVEKNMLNLVRATATRRFPVLIQGPTSSGKTSMISYLAKKTGHKFVRINNHEHTDLQEYLGSYVSDAQGNLRFQEGVLVEAARKGYWIVLDELNLAPTDVLEALNRLLDDNREIFIPETQEIVKPHPHFLLFASQNPPGLYGGRKNLSRAFRNRFLELHFDDIPEEELGIILTGRCQIPPSYAKRIVEVYKELAIRRQSTRLFEKNGFATLRDLFRWANREAVGYEQLALNGYLLLAERVRRPEEQAVVKEVIEKVMRVQLDIPLFYRSYKIPEDRFPETVWNNSMRRLFCLVNEALENREPVLLVGETGCGKTTVCQLLAKIFGKTLHIVNAHQNTEASDIIGAQRPLRNRSEIQSLLAKELKKFVALDDICDVDLDLNELIEIFDKSKVSIDSDTLRRIQDLRTRLKVLFEWCDGSLVQALRQGDFFLLDEVSLTDDSVLERLNSVLEPERSILLAEKGSQDSNVSAADGFQFLATMNPSGDYGKKELSPALRNRFTEIWVPAITDIDDVYKIVKSKLGENDKLFFCRPIVLFARWFGETYGGSVSGAGSGIVSIREILSWIAFINATDTLSPTVRLIHGASMVFIDTLGTNTSAYLAESPKLLARERLRCVEYLSSLSGKDLRGIYATAVTVTITNSIVQAGVFHVNRDSTDITQVPFSFSAPTTAFNAMRIIRGMQLRKPIMLEGSPGVGKSSIMVALAAAAGVELTRINLSEQTDLMDLFGSDSPVEGGKSGEFVWRDAPFLHAMQHGHWVLLDEMNLASQSVLEGLNACLDHRAETYIPELDRTFACHPKFKVFAAQNSHYQGGGRKGLPKSFVNRFTVVYVDLLTPMDLNIITRQLFPDVNPELAEAIVDFVSVLEAETTLKKSFGRVGSPWEFNLRDTIRWFQLLLRQSKRCCAKEFLDIVVKQRFRTAEDRSVVDNLYEKHFHEVYSPRSLGYTLADNYVQVGHSILPRMSNPGSCALPSNDLVMLHCNMLPMESLMTCVEMSWPAIVTGPPNSGKTSLIRLLACLVGARLEEFAINNDIDSMDIVGGFEQVDLSRRASTIWEGIRQFASSMLADIKNTETAAVVLELFDHARTEEASLSHLDEALQILYKLDDKVDSARQSETKSFVSEIVNLKKVASEPTKQLASFEWFDGILVRAVEEGYWLILDNANLCGPSVLDRLNSLLEPNGVLVINEHGLENGQLKILKPHPNFRLFLTVDPHHGELSRAMRNRGIEIFIDDLHHRASAWDRAVLELSARNFDNSVVLEPNKVLDAFNNLSLDSTQLSFSSVSRHIPATLSQMRVYGLLDNLSMIDKSVSDKYLAICTIDQLPLACDRTITRWASAVHNLSLYTDTEKAYCQLVAKLFASFNQFAFSKEIAEIYRSSLIPNYGSYQTYYTLSNPYGLANTKYEADVFDATELARAYDTIFELILIKEKLDVIESQSRTVKISKLNYIERSAAVVTRSKSIKSPKEIFILLTAIFRLMSAIFEGTILRNLRKGTIEKLAEFSNILGDIVILTDRMDVDESQFPVYRDILDALSSDIEIFGTTIVTLNEWDFLQLSIKAFSSRISLRSGKSMDLIWQHMRPAVPTSSEAWGAYLELFEISSKLDVISSTIDLDRQEHLLLLQRNLLRVVSGVLDGDNSFSNVIKALRNEIEEFIACVPARSIGKGNKDKWVTIMDVVLRSEELYGMAHDKKWDTLNNLRLANLSGRALELNIKTLSYAKASVPNIVAIFGSLFSENSSPQRISESFNGHVVFELFNTVSSAEYGRVADVVEIRKEIALAGGILGNSSNSLCHNKLSSLFDVLLKHVHQIIRIHEDDDVGRISIVFANITAAGSEIDQQLVQLERYLRASGKETVRLIPLLQDMRALSGNKSSYSQRDLGRLFIKYSEILWYLYLPSSPHDPAIKPYVERNRLKSKRSKFSSWLKAARIVEGVFTGPNVNLRVQSLESELSVLSDALPVPPCFRPEVSQSHELFQELHRYYESYIADGKIDSLLANVSSSTSRAADVAGMFQRNSYQLMCRLRTQFPYYTDLFEPLEIYLYFMKVGVGLISSSYQDETKLHFDVYRWIVDASVLKRSGISKTAENTQIAILEHGLGQDLSRKILLNLLEWAAIRLNAIGDYDENTLDGINTVLKQFYYQWSLNKKREDAENQAGSSIYKPMTNEEEQDEEFKQMFPDYDGIILLDPSDKRKENEEVNVRIFDAYVKLFGIPHGPGSYPELMDDSISTLNEIAKSGLAASDRDIQHVLPAVMIRTATLVDRLNGSGVPQTNFYIDGNISKAEEVAEMFLFLQVRLTQLVERWPEHETLRDALSACLELLAYPTTTPVAKFLNQVEKELSALHEWQKVASREFSVVDHIDDLSKLAIEWRRLELASWSSLFDKEADSMKKKASEWLFYLYENAIAIPMRICEDCTGFDSHVHELVQAVTAFIGSSPKGQFLTRLQLLRSVATHAGTIRDPNLARGLLRIEHALRNVARLYEQFVPTVEESIQSQRKTLEKEISETILLASWKDTNFLALKEGARRSHHKLYKSVRKFREILSKPVRSVLDSGLGDGILEEDIPTVFVRPDMEITEPTGSFAGYVALCSTITDWTSRPERLIDIAATSQRLKRIVSGILETERPSLISYAADLIDEMQQLRKETPSALTEANKSHVQHLKARKAKLFSETLKDLKRMGLKFRLRSDMLTDQDSVAKILTRTKLFDKAISQNFDDYFFRVLEMTPRVRSCTLSHSDDLTMSQVQRGLGCMESLLYVLISQREGVAAAASLYGRFKGVYDELSALATVSAKNNLQPLDLRGKKLSSLSEGLKLCCSTIDFGYSAIMAHMKLCQDGDTSTAALFTKWKISLKRLASRIDQIAEPSIIAVSTREQIEVLNEVYSTVEKFYNELNEIASTRETYRYIINVLISFLTTEFTATKVGQQMAPGSPRSTITELDHALRTVSDSILVVIQNIRRVSQPAITIQDDNWVTESTQRATKMLQSLHLGSIIAAVEKCLTVISGLDVDYVTGSTLIGALVSLTMPFMQAYSSFAEKLIYNAAADHAKMASGSLILMKAFFSVVSSGYCAPQDQSDGQIDSETQGTGLGEGEGEQNISKTVGDDDDLTDLANQPNEEKEKEDGDVQEDDDAVNMEGEMQGETEEIEGQDREREASDADDDDGEKELDEEVGDVDNLDPSAVDEKLWDDGNTEEQSKEKTTKESLKDSTRTNDLAAKPDEQEGDENTDQAEDGKDDMDGEDKDEEEEEGSMQQEDVVKQQDSQDIDPIAPEGEALDLPEDLNLDKDEEDYKMDDENDDMPSEGDPLDNPMEVEDKSTLEEEPEGQEKQTGSADDEDVEMADQEEKESHMPDMPDNEDDDNQTNEMDANEEEDNSRSVDDRYEVAKEEHEKEQEINRDSQGIGLHGPEDAFDEYQETEAAAKGSAGREEDGQDAEAQETIEESTAQEKGPLAVNEETQQSMAPEKSEQTKEHQRRLGDSSEEWHRQNREIQEADKDAEESVQNDGKKFSDEYRHMDESEATQDTQALGSASNDLRQTIEDDSMAIDDVQEPTMSVPDVPLESEENVLKSEESSDRQQSTGGIVGDRKLVDEFGAFEDNVMEDDDLVEPAVELPVTTELQVDVAKDQAYRSVDEARDLWQRHERATADLSNALCEQLRLILEPTLSTKLRGDFRTGKRLNMKRIIPYIASGYKKDKIWLRRTKPSKREYQIMIALDDSKSMSESQSVELAFDTLTLVTRALERLESGQLSIVRFGETCEVVHPFQKPFTSEAGAQVFQWFGFTQVRTNVHALVEKSMALFNEAKSDTKGDMWQLEIIISDGVCGNHEQLQRLVRRAREQKIMLVFIVVDGLQKSADRDGQKTVSQSILDMKQVAYETDKESGQMSLKMTSYLSSFPFEFYVIVRSISELPSVLASVLRQYFAEIAEVRE
ncbi:uncharacterized protein V1513DRAFT_425144 [Lipomyces chichibuensis]|uniref:uncharacterized protein n=1 Tax=Lipomyces chichibuensis TaxID=1546026 RepID=UPI0033439BBC